MYVHVISMCLCVAVSVVFGKPRVADDKVNALSKIERSIQQTNLMIGEIYLTTLKLAKLAEMQNAKRCPAQWKKVDNACYYLQPYWKRDWSSAQSSCLRIGGSLVSMNTSETIESVRTYLSSLAEILPKYMLSDVWVGGYEYMGDGTWFWVNGEPIDYENENLDAEEREVDVTGPRWCLTWSDGFKSVLCDKVYFFVCVRDLM